MTAASMWPVFRRIVSGIWPTACSTPSGEAVREALRRGRAVRHNLRATGLKKLAPWRGTMKFFVDTGDFKEIEELSETGLLDGVTTNPSLVAKSGRDFKELIAEICKVVPGPVSAEVAATDYDGMMAEAEVL